MDATLIIKIAGIGIMTAVTAQILSKSGRDEQATLISIAGIVLVMITLVERISYLFEALETAFGL
ncbi:MAG: stage III sporulation protein AC [Firmicutes bacterium]|nr:stage III sporulation protein AC [Bacillota bacterium]MCD7944902.1 stage III sporulation protein AC [Clostridia bacterium]MCD8055989.1 stage III sporulation protein AC [Clostridiales bacterium]MCD7831037.1 stage III sporulation protein AC [Bacillota bacterium]MCD8002888.1 stage III sporulation protein AC [Clostridia bacterium]